MLAPMGLAVCVLSAGLEGRGCGLLWVSFPPTPKKWNRSAAVTAC